jgi:hypothetical protein
MAHRRLPGRGIAEHRQYLLERSNSYYVLYLDDDLILERDLVERLMRAMSEKRCGFVGSAPAGLSCPDDERPLQQGIELREGPVVPDSPERGRTCQVAWNDACILYDADKLREAGGFRFRQALPTGHCGEDVLIHARLLERYGGFGIIPPGVYHQELPATISGETAHAERMQGEASQRDRDIMIEVPAGELLDKITILEIKEQRIRDPGKLAHVREELRHLASVRDRCTDPSDRLEELVAELRDVNGTLWSVEDDLRDCERRSEFGPRFIELARSVYHQNDRRAAVKRSINELIGSRLVEEKSYAQYKAA